MGLGTYVLIATQLVAYAPAVLHAQEAESDALAKIMSRHLHEVKARKEYAARMQIGPIARLKLSGRTYKNGETWSVAFLPTDNLSTSLMTRMTAVPEQLKPTERDLRYFDFKVIALNDDGSARIEVRDRIKPGADRADARIDHMILVLNRQYIVTQKEIYYRDGKKPIALPMSPTENVALGFSAFPVDIPNLLGLEGLPLDSPPAVPDKLAKITNSNFAASLREGLDFNTTDIYARQFRAIWREGEPWPAYVQSAMGTSVLVK